MPKPYSYDLRQKVIQAIKLDGLKISEAYLVTPLMQGGGGKPLHLVPVA